MDYLVYLEWINYHFFQQLNRELKTFEHEWYRLLNL